MTQDSPPLQSLSQEVSSSVHITREGLQQLQQQLTALRDEQRPVLLKKIERATLFMDPSVREDIANVARYDLSQVDQRITDLEDAIKRANVLEPPTDSNKVQPGSRVRVRPLCL